MCGVFGKRSAYLPSNFPVFSRTLHVDLFDSKQGGAYILSDGSRNFVKGPLFSTDEIKSSWKTAGNV
jgi:hypothetical protein